MGSRKLFICKNRSILCKGVVACHKHCTKEKKGTVENVQLACTTKRYTRPESNSSFQHKIEPTFCKDTKIKYYKKKQDQYWFAKSREEGNVCG